MTTIALRYTVPAVPKPRNPNKGIPKTARLHPVVLDAMKACARASKRKLSEEIDIACEFYARTKGQLIKNVDRSYADAR